MSRSPSYKPVLDTTSTNPQCHNLITDPVLNPFYYAQDGESWYAQVAANACNESHQQKLEEQKQKKKKKTKSKPFKNTSFIIRKEPGHVRQLIKIIIHDLDDRHIDEIDTEPDSASVNIQYLVKSDYDDIMSETELLVSKIVKKLSST
ncbi:hypothetical protein PYW08_000419 [Mythimna loreyi]|uniref:Uncharacterized protein n=1 Tax=Mythimna loreyi TaxID=667449 RepID=A0ACC2RCF0_9NEOP|nr:hypothetical protein PYW08_000419 [Mythimna loreyi]